MTNLRNKLLKRKENHGFTLIELVIVVVILGILSAIAIPSYGGIQAQARVGRYISDMQTTVKYLEIYKADHGSYPKTDGWQFQNSGPAGHDQYIPGLVPEVTKYLPYAAEKGEYVYQSNGADFKLIRYQGGGIDSSEWSRVPSARIDRYGADWHDRYGFWSKNGADL